MEMKGKDVHTLFDPNYDDFVWFFPPVTEAVKANPRTADATSSDIGTVIKEWLCFAMERNGRRKEREERKKQQIVGVQLQIVDVPMP